MTDQHETILVAGLMKPQILQAIRKALSESISAEFEACVLSDNTAGSSDTEDAHIQWVHAGDGDVIALQGLGKADGHLWEFCAALLPDTRYAISRRTIHRSSSAALTSTSDLVYALWDEILALTTSWDVHTPRTTPTFVTVAAAALAQSDLRVIHDQSQTVADLRDDVEYWRDLARSQARLLREQKSLAAGFNTYSEDLDDAPKQALSSQVDTTSLKNLDQWATLNSEHIVIMPRAISAAKRSPYENPPLVYACLELLANEYRQTKLGEIDRNVFKDKCMDLGLEVGGSVDLSRAGEAGDEYFVRWGSRRRLLDQHLGKGTVRDPRFILRIYYTWSEDDAKVIVGWLPSHLSNSKS